MYLFYKSYWGPKHENQSLSIEFASEVYVFFFNYCEKLWCSEDFLKMRFLEYVYLNLRRSYTNSIKIIVKTMADANGHNSVPRLPHLPTFGANESQQQGQQLPRVGVTFAPGVASTVGTEGGAAAAASLSAKSITPPRTIVLNLSATSALSSITNNRTTEAAINNNIATQSPGTPGFSRPRSDDNSLLSGDDEAGWDRKADKMLASVLHEREEEDADNDQVLALLKVLEFDQLLVQEDEALAGEAAPPAPILDTTTVTMKSTLPQLKEVATILCQIPLVDARKKADVFARIRNIGNALITLGDSETSFQYQKVRVSGSTASNDPYWLVLNPEIPLLCLASTWQRGPRSDSLVQPIQIISF